MSTDGWPVCSDCGQEIEYRSCQQEATEAVEALVLAAHRKFSCPSRDPEDEQ